VTVRHRRSIADGVPTQVGRRRPLAHGPRYPCQERTAATHEEGRPVLVCAEKADFASRVAAATKWRPGQPPRLTLDRHEAWGGFTQVLGKWPGISLGLYPSTGIVMSEAATSQVLARPDREGARDVLVRGLVARCARDRAGDRLPVPEGQDQAPLIRGRSRGTRASRLCFAARSAAHGGGSARLTKERS
jgi:hypothetical protein